MSSLYFVIKIVSAHYLIWKWLEISLTRLSYKMNYLSSLQLKFPIKLKLKGTTYIKTYGPQTWANTWKSNAELKICIEVCSLFKNWQWSNSCTSEKTPIWVFRKDCTLLFTKSPWGKLHRQNNWQKIKLWWCRGFTSPLYFVIHRRKFVSNLKEQFHFLKEKQ